MDARDALWESATGLSIPQIHLVNPEAERQDGAQESKTTGCEDRSAIGIFSGVCKCVRARVCLVILKGIARGTRCQCRARAMLGGQHARRRTIGPE